jgi:hypothetical protein
MVSTELAGTRQRQRPKISALLMCIYAELALDSKYLLLSTDLLATNP